MARSNAQGRKKKQGKKRKHTNASSPLFNVDKCDSTPTNPQQTVPPSSCIRVLVSGVDLCDDHTHGGATAVVGAAVDADSAVGAAANGNGNDSNDVDSAQKNDTNMDNGSGGNEGQALSPTTAVTVTTNANNKEDKTEVKEDPNSNSNENHGANNNEDDMNTSTSTSKSKSTQENKTEDKPKRAIVHIIRDKFETTDNSTEKKQKTSHKTKHADLPNGDCGDGIVNPFPKDEVEDKYWAQRKRFFSKFDNGIQLDKESWYSVTPEAIADHISKRMVKDIESSRKEEKSGGAIILDAFCGCGGNAIGFAKLDPSQVKLVICVDIDRSKLRMAANNASIYGISTDQIRFIQADTTFILEQCYKDGALVDFDQEAKLGLQDDEVVETEICKGYKIGGYDLLPPTLDAIFLSPPWGGPDYMNTNKKGFLLNAISVKTWNDQSLNGENLLVAAKKASQMKLVIYFLPRTLNVHSMAQSAWRAGYQDIEVEKNLLNGKFKTITVYLKNS